MAYGDPGELRFEERMSDIESLMWGLEQVSPSLLSTMTLVAVLDRQPDKVVLNDKLDMLTRRVPRLRDRVDTGLLAMVPPRWEPDPDFSTGRHVSRVRLSEEAGFDDLFRVVEGQVTAPFPAGRPPWHITFVDGLEGDRAAMVARLHHSYTDGQGAVRIAMELFDFDRVPPPIAAPARRPQLPPAPPAPLLGRLVDDLAHEARRTAGVARSLLPWAVGALRSALSDAGDSADYATDLARSLRDLAVSAARPGSPLLSPRSDGANVGALQLGLEDMRATAAKAGGKVNDVFLAGVLGGLALYHRKHGECPRSVRVGVPVSTRSDGTIMRNQVQGVVFHGPLTVADPAERIRLLHEMVVHLRAQPWLDLVDHAAAAAAHLPFARQFLASLARSADILASNLPGPPMPLYLAGAEVERLVPVGPRAGAGANLTLLSYNGAVAVGVNADPAAVPDLDVFIDCRNGGFEELTG